ncbi:hypothetical protein FOPG_01085 [Fusarium oxysporum f. sp. conglutinans race 2 54008]|uniref:Uncharacterized protein n=1 Tax=Fusarium oxysporum f. sp. conglutinans race 2 54008 TaxID=1089457 RepID=X0IGY4_FUSOX|nr:hypothetical protein FOPG_01085 [Fusarium oxysporum f. sp. conglutinans race 2 54008]
MKSDEGPSFQSPGARQALGLVRGPWWWIDGGLCANLLMLFVHSAQLNRPSKYAPGCLYLGAKPSGLSKSPGLDHNSS